MKKVFKKLFMYSLAICLTASQLLVAVPAMANTGKAPVKAKKVTKVVLSNAKFNNVTELTVNTSVKLTGINSDKIVITKPDGKTIPADKISNINIEAKKLTLSIDADLFTSLTSTIGTKIATKAFGNFAASAAAATAYKRKVLMIVADFPDAKAEDNTGKNPIAGKTTYAEGNKVNGHVMKSAQDYYDWFMPRTHDYYFTSSYGQVDLDVTLVKNPDNSQGVFTCPRTISGDNGYAINSYDILTDALTVAKPVLKDYPGGPYDFIYVVSVENCNVRGSYAQPWGADQVRALAGRTDLNGFVKLGFDAYDTWKYKVACHETGHMFGLADYYTNSYSGYGGGQCDPVTGRPDYYSLMGHWYLMGYTNGPASDILALEKWRLGWVQKNQVDIINTPGTTTHRLTPLETPNGTKMILIQDPNSDAAYAIEYRQAAGVDNTSIVESSIDPNPKYAEKNFSHYYGDFHSEGLLMYKFNIKGGPITIVDLFPNNTTKELGTMLDYSVLGKSSGIYSYTDASSGITIRLRKETKSVDTVTVVNNPAPTKIKPILSEVKLIDFSTLEFKTNYDLRGIDSDSIEVKKGNQALIGVKFNQITPTTIRVTFNKGQFTSATDTENVTVTTNAFSFFGSSGKVAVAPLKNANVPVLSEAKFNTLTQIQAKSNVELAGISTSNISIKKENGSYVDTNNIKSVKFDTASKRLTIDLKDGEFANENETAGATLSTSMFSNYVPDAINLQMAQFDPKINICESSNTTPLEPFAITLQKLDIATPANTIIYAVNDTMDINGMIVKGTYSNDSQHVLPITSANVTGFDSSKPVDNQVLTVTFDGKTANYSVTIKAKEQFVLQSIAITTPASIGLYSVGDSLDISGMSVTGTYTGGIKQVLTITPANITGFDSSKPVDNQVLTVNYKEKTASYGIQVKIIGVNALYKITNKSSRKIMELSDNKPGATIDQWWDWSDTDGDGQCKWKFVEQANGYYKICSKYSQLFLEVRDKSDAEGAEITQWGAYDGDDSENWKIEQVDGKYCKVVNKKSGKVLEIKDGNNDDGTIIVQSTYTGKDSQLWYFERLENLK